MNLALRVTALLLAGEIACWWLARLAPRARPWVRGWTLMGAVLLPAIAALSPSVMVIWLPSDGQARELTSMLPATGRTLAGWLIAVWAIGALARLAIVLKGQQQLREWLGAAPPARCRRILRMARAVADRLGIAAPRLRWRADHGTVPFTVGLLRPAIVLPRDASRWPLARLEAVLIHEMEHVRRRDVAARLSAELACCVYWFHPIARWHAARLRVESELACDEAVLATGARPSRYASDLLELACRGPASLLGATGFSDDRALSERVEAILAPTPRRRPLGRSGRLALAGFAVALTIAMACYEPTLGPRRLSAAGLDRARSVVVVRSAAGPGPGARKPVHVRVEAGAGAGARHGRRRIAVLAAP